MSGPIVLLYKGGEHATGAPDCFTFFRDRTRGLRRPGFGTAWHVSELGEGCNTSLCRAMYRKVIPSVCQMFARVYANPTPSSGSLERSGDPRRRQGAKAMLVSVVQVLQYLQGIVMAAGRPMDVRLLLLD